MPESNSGRIGIDALRRYDDKRKELERFEECVLAVERDELGRADDGAPSDDRGFGEDLGKVRDMSKVQRDQERSSTP